VGHRVVPIKSFARGGDFDSASPAQLTEKEIAEAVRDGYPLASCRFSFVLAMEVAMSRRQTEGGARNPPTDPRHELG
jgi:hypothetical protein